MNSINIQDAEFDKLLKESNKPILLEFWAEWCGPCKMIGPIIEEIYNEKKNAFVKKMDVDANALVPAQYGIRSIPTIMMFYKKNVVDKIVGAAPKRIIESKLDIHIKEFEDETQKNIELIGLTIVEDKVKFISLNKDGTYNFIDDDKNNHNLLIPFIFESNPYKIAIEELEYLINNSKTKEADLQKFFERYPDFIINDDYKAAHSHVMLQNCGSNLIPDFILEPINPNGLSDLLELKLPTTQTFRLKKNRPRFASAVLEACAQLREYSKFFDEERNREIIINKYGLTVYKPKMIVIIGRRGNFDSKIIRTLESDLPNFSIRNYDDILERARRKYFF